MIFKSRFNKLPLLYLWTFPVFRVVYSYVDILSIILQHKFAGLTTENPKVFVVKKIGDYNAKLISSHSTTFYVLIKLLLNKKYGVQKLILLNALQQKYSLQIVLLF